MHNKTCWACGPDNSAGLRLDIKRDELSRKSFASFLIDGRYEGNDGIAHGGLLCSIFDSVMTNAAMACCDKRVFTAKLEVKFKKKIKIGERIKVSCWFEKKYFGFLIMKGEIVNGENKVAAKASALFSQQ